MQSERASVILSLGLLLASGCASSAANESASAGSTPPTTGDATRAIDEADIIQIDAGRLYAMSRSGTLSVVDVSIPGRLALLGQSALQGEPFEMYQRGHYLVTMTNSGTSTQQTSAFVSVIDVSDPNKLTNVASVGVPGEIADSRIVGNVLYLASYQNAQCYGCGDAPRTLVTSFDVTDPAGVVAVDQKSFQSNAPDGYNLPWGSNWKRSIVVTDQRLYIGGHADIDPNTLQTGTAKEGIIDVLDITDPGGKLVSGARIVVAGAVLSRWQMDENDGILRVISQRGAGRTGNGLAEPEVATFRIDSTQSFMPLGSTTLVLPEQEGLRTVRFDSDRAYAITYNQTDPLFAVDLSNPAAPVQRGELQMPGFMFHLIPYGPRVLGLGIDRTDPQGSLNVSLFDVSNLDAPTMIRRVAFAGASFSEDYEILNGELPEDQDRIQKAFRVFDDGLVVVPYSSPSGCNDSSSGVQLVTWSGDTLERRGILPLPGNPRRAFENQGELVGVSDSHVRSYSASDLDSPMQTADLVIGGCSDAPYAYYGNNQPPANDQAPLTGSPYPACSVAAAGSESSFGFVGIAAAGALSLALVRSRRKAR